jgi:threonine dehydrogenase-like Zn-dependent dehydrogenase
VAEALGFQTVAAGDDPVQAIREATDDEGADIVFDTAAHPAVAARLSAATAVRGTIVLVGIYKAPAALDLQAIAFAEQRLVGVRVYTRADVERAVALIESDELDLGRIPVRVFALEDTAAAFELATAATGVLKVLVSPGFEEATPPATGHGSR